MQFNNLLYEKEGGLVTITLNRPKALNALCAQLTDELGDLLTVLERDPEVRVLIITGGTKAFAAGADITEMMDKNTLSTYRWIPTVHEVFEKLEDFRAPVIAAINGPCRGGGCELALCCEFSEWPG